MAYRVRQFTLALIAGLRPLAPVESAEACAHLPETAWPLFAAMPRADQRHSLAVLRAVRGDDVDDSVLQAALLHDCAKQAGGVRLWHRVTVVLLKAFRPALLAHWAAESAPPRSAWRYPLWAYLHHPQQGAEMARAAGCAPLAVALIRHHQDTPSVVGGDAILNRWLVVLRAADDDH